MPVPERNISRAMLPGKGFILLFFLGMTLSLFSQQYNFRVFNTPDGLAQSYVYSIVQDERGYLWVGTGNGLSRYNGFKFENKSLADSLTDNFITSSLSDGRWLWFGHMNGTLTCFDGQRYFRVDLPGSDGTPVTHMTRDRKGGIWVSSYTGSLWKLDSGGAVKQFIMQDPLNIVTFEFLNGEELLIGTDAGLVRGRILETGKTARMNSFESIPLSRITCIQAMRNGKGYYVTTEDEGIFTLSYSNGRFDIALLNTGTEYQPTGIQFIYEDSQNMLWLATFGNGLVGLTRDKNKNLTRLVRLDAAHGFPSDHVKTIFEDREGNIWCGSYGAGLIQLTRKTFSFLKPDVPLAGGIFSVFTDSSYRWLGTGNGLIQMDLETGRTVRQYGKASGLPEDTISAVYGNDEKELWIGTDKNGLYRLDTRKGKAVRYPFGYGDLENSITALCGNGQNVWAGTRKGLCALDPGLGQITWYTISQGGLPHNVIQSLYLDRSGKLWISTHSNVLAWLQDGRIHKIPVSSEAGSLTMGPITEDADAQIWAGSRGNGVFKIYSDSLANITSKDGLLSDYCYSIVGDDQNYIWIGHKNGLSRIRSNDYSVKAIDHFEGSPEILQFNPNALDQEEKGKISFGTDQGLVIYDPSMEHASFVPPALSITSFRVNDVEKEVSEVITLSPGIYRIRIGYLGISLKEPELVTYQYNLDGYDQQPVITKDTTVTFNHLTEGHYQFMLNAASGDGAVTVTPVIINIVIKKPVWKKWWFYLINFVLISGILYGYARRREYMFRMEKAVLEGKVQERTQEIRKQKDEIESQRDMIRKKSENITSSIVYASQIQEAVLTPMEFIDQLFPDHFILSRPKDIVSGDFYWVTERNGKIVIALADCTGHGVPGAFMSLLGITFLNEIVNVQGIITSEEIVTHLRNKVSQSLQQSRKDSGTNDGIDIALCVFDPLLKTIQFTGAMSDMVYIRKGKLNIAVADNLSVSALQEDSRAFTRKEIDVRKGDVFYLFSDGYQDQFGGQQNKKYKKHRFLDKLLEIHAMPMKVQKDILEKNLSEWMQDNIQTDDITVMGIRF